MAGHLVTKCVVGYVAGHPVMCVVGCVACHLVSVCSAVCGWLAGYYVCSGAMAGHLAVICVVTVCVVGCVVCHLVTHV